MHNPFGTALAEQSIVVNAHATDWRAAITLSGDALVAGGVTTDEYTAAMIKTIEDLGPYVVIAPGIALAHSRPSPAVLRTGLSWVTLAEPVVFGNEANDPVHLVIGLAATDHDGHLAIMSALAGVLSDPAVLASLTAASSASDVRSQLLSYVV